jgi:hypothetical protein
MPVDNFTDKGVDYKLPEEPASPCAYIKIEENNALRLEP